ncbi:Hsp20/alpha crystallin family protein [Luteimonas suaedae]|uniref:Hsp20/alpha crystallin family protein n=1 Tax=Luteimonas suaedae TaxID=2605430 RepID=UPI00165A0A85|nr:Hsp20/alpha crystallin family protein [Luteimonas suaedae]
MSLMNDLIPWSRSRGTDLERQGRDPFFNLQREVNRIFDDTLRGMGTPFDGGRGDYGWPNIEVRQEDRQLTVMADLPGMSEKEIEVLLEEDALVLRGEREGRRERGQFSERFYGRFERRIPLPPIQADGVSATFKDGLLTVTLPKEPEAAPRGRRITVNHR